MAIPEQFAAAKATTTPAVPFPAPPPLPPRCARPPSHARPPPMETNAPRWPPAPVDGVASSPASFRVGMGVRLSTTGHTCGASRSATAKIPCQRYRPCVPWSNALNTIEEVEEVERVAVLLVLLVPVVPVAPVALWEGSSAAAGSRAGRRSRGTCRWCATGWSCSRRALAAGTEERRRRR